MAAHGDTPLGVPREVVNAYCEPGGACAENPLWR